MRTGPCTHRRCLRPPRASGSLPWRQYPYAILLGDAKTLQNMADPAADRGGAAAGGRCGRHADVRAARRIACRRDGSGLPASRCAVIRHHRQRRNASRKQGPCQAPRVRRLRQLLSGRADAALPRPFRRLHGRATRHHRNNRLADGLHSRRPAPAAAAAFRLNSKLVPNRPPKWPR